MPSDRTTESAIENTAVRAAAALPPQQSASRSIGGNYSRFVGMMKLVLPMAAGVLVLMIVIWPQFEDKPDGFRLRTSTISLETAGGQKLVNARYTGTDRRDNPEGREQEDVRTSAAFWIDNTRPTVADPRIDDGAGQGQRRARHSADVRSVGVDGSSSSGWRGTAVGTVARASFPASRDRSAGLTGPASKDRVRVALRGSRPSASRPPVHRPDRLDRRPPRARAGGRPRPPRSGCRRRACRGCSRRGRWPSCG